jgi:biopolymer transport protein ExbD
MLKSKCLVILFAVATAFSSALPTAKASELCPAKMSIRKDGKVVLDGTVYSDRTQLKLRLGEFRAQHPHCSMSFVVEKDVDFKAIGRAIVLLQELGFEKVGFLTEPRRD